MHPSDAPPRPRPPAPWCTAAREPKNQIRPAPHPSAHETAPRPACPAAVSAPEDRACWDPCLRNTPRDAESPACSGEGVQKLRQTRRVPACGKRRPRTASPGCRETPAIRECTAARSKTRENPLHSPPPRPRVPSAALAELHPCRHCGLKHRPRKAMWLAPPSPLAVPYPHRRPAIRRAYISLMDDVDRPKRAPARAPAPGAVLPPEAYCLKQIAVFCCSRKTPPPVRSSNPLLRRPG